MIEYGRLIDVTFKSISIRRGGEDFCRLLKIDDDFFGPKGRKKEEMNNAWRAKFTQNPEAKDILLKTKDAKIQHFIRGKKPEVWIGLMRIRKELKDK